MIPTVCITQHDDARNIRCYTDARIILKLRNHDVFATILRALPYSDKIRAWVNLTGRIDPHGTPQAMFNDPKFLLIFSGIFFTAYKLYKALIVVKESLKADLPKPYRCRFTKVIMPLGTNNDYDSGSIHIRSARDSIELPFPPYIGLTVSDNFDGAEWYSGTIRAVHWNNSGRFFLCQVEPHRLTEANIVGAVLYNHQRNGWAFDTLHGDTKESFDEWKAREKAKEAP